MPAEPHSTNAAPEHCLLQRYRALLDSGEFKPDTAQARAAAALDALDRRLGAYRPPRRSLFGFVRAHEDAPKGLYIHGAVGRGKSRLMDLFFAGASAAKKRRVHFNAFMLETHARMHEWRALSDSEKRARPEYVREAGDDPIAPVAKRIAEEATLLCFDEFQVTDVTDAMILGRLFEKLFAHGVVIVATSNTAPEHLYEGGLNRALFLPFIAMIEQHLDVLELGGGHDYRLEHLAGLDLYITPLGAKAGAAMDAVWLCLTGTAKGMPLALPVLGRTLRIEQAADGVARLTFAELCLEPRSAADYLALARQFHTVLIDNIPVLKPEQLNEARRFTLLIDTLYDEKVKLVCSAAAPPFALYPAGEEAEAFKRAASRLTEMQSADYLRLTHAAGADASAIEQAV